MNRLVCSTILILFIVTLVFIQFSTSYVLPRSPREVREDSDDTGSSDLYNEFCKITRLNSTNFNKEIFEQQKHKLWLVEFYNHWCGYCIRFVAVMKAFATEVYEWRDVVAVGTIDCANSMNNKICRSHDIKRVPSLRIFPPNSEVNFVGLEFGRGSETTIPEMRENLARIMKSYHNSQDKIEGPVNLKLVRHSALGRLLTEIPSSVLYVMLVFEPKDSLIGSQVALDISRTQEIQVRLVDPKNKNLTELVGLAEDENGAVIIERNSLETLVNPETRDRMIENNDLTKVLNEAATSKELNVSPSVDPNHIHQVQVAANFTPLIAENFTREGLNKAVRKYLIDRGINIAPELPVVPIVHTNVSVNEIKEAIRREDELKAALNVSNLSTIVFQMDLEAAIIYSMTKEITLKRNITGEQLDALRNFITVIIKYFPTAEQGKKFFSELKQKELDDKDSVCGEDFRRTFKELQQKYNPFMPNAEWVGCRGTIPTLRGYPCSLWTTFHTLASFEELQDRKMPEETPEVLNAMAGYVKNFFSCTPCAEHFSRMAKTIDGNVTSQRDAVMWLWKAHNNVNRRLGGDETEDPRHHKVQFPTKEVCPSCHTSDGSWDEAQVFSFISNMFTNIVQLNPHELLSYLTTTPQPNMPL